MLSGLYPYFSDSVIFFFTSSTESVDFYEHKQLEKNEVGRITVPALLCEDISTNPFQQMILFSYLNYQSTPPSHSNIEPLRMPAERNQDTIKPY